ncbi:MAG: electron transport complex subunit RsxE [Deltaproteobacteria bacterium]|nr:electron transport complex subunit RsxE [Deltaproteobacteria bacterium]MBW2361254.1 electron transport complex subunit RsxE [Deltaproteobacteria bacterium]
MRQTTPQQDLLRGLWRENPVLIQMLGLCPALAVTNNVENSLAMGLATFFVLCGSSLLVSLCKRWIPGEIRISVYILIIATFVTVADLCLAALLPDIHKALGAFIALIVVNCMILGRQEAFASRRPVGRALLDAVGTGAGFTLALVMLGGTREVLGSGSFLNVPLFGPSYEPWVVMILPPGGFLTLGVLLLGLAWWEERRRERVKAGGVPAGADMEPSPALGMSLSERASSRGDAA